MAAPSRSGALYKHTVQLSDHLPTAAHIQTETVQTIPNNTLTNLAFTSPINVDPLNLGAWRSVWTATTPGTFTTSIRGWYLMGGSALLNLTTTRFELIVRHNSLTVASSGGDAQGNTSRAVSVLMPSRPGDTFNLAVFQVSGADVDTVIYGDTPNMWIIRVK